MGFNGLGLNKSEPPESKINIGANTEGYSGESLETSEVSALDELRNRSKEKKSDANSINMNRGIRGGAITEDMQEERARQAEQNKIKAEQAKVKAKQTAKKAKETSGDIGQIALAFIPYVLHLFGFLMVITLVPNVLLKHVEVYYPNGKRYDYEQDRSLSYKMSFAIGFLYLVLWFYLFLFGDYEYLGVSTLAFTFVIGIVMMLRACIEPIARKLHQNAKNQENAKFNETLADMFHLVTSLGSLYVAYRIHVILVILIGASVIFNIFNAKEYTKKWNDKITEARDKKKEQEQEQEQMSQAEQTVYDNISTPVREQSQGVAETIFCPSCGTKIAKVGKFCPNCGKQI